MAATDSAPVPDPVAVIGAGPVGMTAALALARHGVPTVVLEARDALSGEGSRSICTQGSVLGIFERLGCAEPMLAKGVRWTVGRTYFRDIELFETHLGETHEAALPPFINIGQQDVEACLLDAVQRQDLIDLRWAHAVTGLRQDDRSVRLEVDSPAGRAEVRAPYAVACDGPRSQVRKLLGLEMPGHTHTDRFLIADIRADLPFPRERRFFFDPPFNPGRQVLIHPQPDGVWRIDWQIPPETDIEEERRSGRLDERIRAVIGDADYELVWLTNYRFHQRVAERFRVGRALLAGDAAHLMAPFGARGLNSGTADAENLAWKLALVLGGVAPDDLLETYHVERREAALHNLRTVGETMRFLTPRTRVGWWLRNAILRGSVRLPRLRRLVNSGRLYAPHTYRDSPIIVDEPRAASQQLPAPGSLAPDGPCTVPGSPHVTRLRHLFGDGFLALYFPGGDGDAARVAEQLQAASPPATTTIAVVDEGEVTATYAPDGDRLYLVRPDGYIAARGRGRDAGDLETLVSRAIGVRAARTP
jgi:2-polyprenyl-6-methoxyphenol hydroxylase-like FAD-dependent oxidoreductase